MSIFGDYLVSLFTNKQPDYSIQSQITSTISAFSTIILVIITANYAISTREMLDEQVKLRKIASIEKVLENVYSPINIAFNKFRLNCESLPEDRIPSVYDNEFKDLNDVIMGSASKYYHLFNQETINYYNEDVWEAWLQYSNEPNITNYQFLNSRINVFNGKNTEHLNIEKKSLNSFQQHQININSEDKEPKYNAIIEGLTTFVENAKKNFGKYYIIRFPQLMLLSFAFTLSAVVIQKIIVNWFYLLVMSVLIFTGLTRLNVDNQHAHIEC